MPTQWSLLVMVAGLGLAGVAQEPVPTPAPAPVQAPAPVEPWIEGTGRGASYREAFAQALDDAVGKAVRGAAARGAAVRSRLLVVARWQGVPQDWFDGAADRERDWVLAQTSGILRGYEVVRRGKAADGAWEVALRVRGAVDDLAGLFVIDLAGGELRQWELARFEEGAAGGPFATVTGAYEAPSLRESLRATGLVRLMPRGDGAEAGSSLGPPLVASHRVTVTWQPMLFRSLVERPNRARPTTGPRPQALTAASVQAEVKGVELAGGLEVFDRQLTVSLDVPPGTSVDRLDALAVQLADKAKAAVAEALFFALQPPTVVRKWPADGGAEWYVEVAMARRIAMAYEQFVVGVPGSLASPDWRPLGTAAFVGGTDGGCTFRLALTSDPSRIEPGVTQVRPVAK